MQALSAALEGDPSTVVRSNGAVLIRRFTPDVSTRLFNALGNQSDAPLTLDLRGCPGGDAEAALALAGEFLPQGTPLARLCDAADPDAVELVVARFAQAYTMPLTILVDRATASAAELFTAILQATGRATVHGEHTAGKDSAQRLVRDAAGIRYATAARFELPDGTSLAKGVTPDHFRR